MLQYAKIQLNNDTRSSVFVRTQIEKQAQYLLKTPLARIKMSDVEQGYAERYHSLVIKHFQNSVTGNIPERLGRLDEDEMGASQNC